MRPTMDSDVMLSKAWKTIQSLNHAFIEAGGTPPSAQYLQIASLTEFITVLALNSIQFVYKKECGE